jgi:hypothetical protein
MGSLFRNEFILRVKLPNLPADKMRTVKDSEE